MRAWSSSLRKLEGLPDIRELLWKSWYTLSRYTGCDHHQISTVKFVSDNPGPNKTTVSNEALREGQQQMCLLVTSIITHSIKITFAKHQLELKIASPFRLQIQVKFRKSCLAMLNMERETKRAKYEIKF